MQKTIKIPISDKITKEKLEKLVAKHFSDAIVFIGLPKNIRSEHYKGFWKQKA